MRTAPALVRPSKKEMKWWIHNISCASDQSHRCRRFKKSKKKLHLPYVKPSSKKSISRSFMFNYLQQKQPSDFQKKMQKTKQNKTKPAKVKKAKHAKVKKCSCRPQNFHTTKNPTGVFVCSGPRGGGGQQAGGMGEDKCAFSPLVI